MKHTLKPKPRRVWGYCIHVFRGVGYQPPSSTTPVLWRDLPPARQWQQVIDDPATQQAWMVRSGRELAQFQFSRSR
jgi:hypothetical protein